MLEAWRKASQPSLASYFASSVPSVTPHNYIYPSPRLLMKNTPLDLCETIL
jgi:hypothetical protein